MKFLRRRIIVAAITFLARVCLAVPVIPQEYPLFLQCDARWGNDLMGGNDTSYDTICIQGCAMSSVSMMLHGKGWNVDHRPTNPGSLNQWLRENNGYKCISGNCNNLVLNAIDQLDPKQIQFISEDPKPSISNMKAYVVNQNPMQIAHVRNSHHFVLVVGFDSDANKNTTFYVNDPYYNVTSYDYADVSDIILYRVVQQQQQHQQQQQLQKQQQQQQPSSSKLGFFWN